MKKILSWMLIMSSCMISCDKDQPANIPECITEWINVVNKEFRWNPPAYVKEYKYKGNTAYLISANCCDQYITVIDGNCNYICAPSGGISGGGDGKCRTFYEEAEFVRVVWEDER